MHLYFGSDSPSTYFCRAPYIAAVGTIFKVLWSNIGLKFKPITYPTTSRYTTCYATVATILDRNRKHVCYRLMWKIWILWMIMDKHNNRCVINYAKLSTFFNNQNRPKQLLLFFQARPPTTLQYWVIASFCFYETLCNWIMII